MARRTLIVRPTPCLSKEIRRGRVAPLILSLTAGNSQMGWATWAYKLRPLGYIYSYAAAAGIDPPAPNLVGESGSTATQHRDPEEKNGETGGETRN